MKRLCVLLGGLFIASSAWADKGLQSIDALVPFAYETLTVTATVQSLTSATYDIASGKAKRATMTCDFGAVVRYTYDGSTTPTTNVGHLVATGITVVFQGDLALANTRIVASKTFSTPCQVTYER